MLRRLSLIALVLITPHRTHADEVTHRIGVIAPLTGFLANYGAQVRKSIESISHPGIEWVFEDEACDPAKTVSAFKKLTDVDRISFVLGPCCASPQKALAPLLRRGKQLVMLPNAVPESVFEHSAGNMVSVQYSIESEATFLAEQMNRRGLNRVAVILVENDYSRAMDSAFGRAFKGEVVYSFRAPHPDAQYMRAAAIKLKTIDFDSLFIPDISPLLSGFLTEIKRLGISARPVFANYGAQLPDVLTAEKDNAEGIMYAYPNVPDTEDAYEYFPKLAATVLAQAVADCNGVVDCVKKTLGDNQHVRAAHDSSRAIVIKKIEGRRYSRVVPN